MELTPERVRAINSMLRRAAPMPDAALVHWLTVCIHVDAARHAREIAAQAQELRAAHRNRWNGLQLQAHSQRIANHFRFAELPLREHFNCRCSPAP